MKNTNTQKEDEFQPGWEAIKKAALELTGEDHPWTPKQFDIELNDATLVRGINGGGRIIKEGSFQLKFNEEDLDL
ncbi:MAG TPA: hypothetical protein P5096_03185 [Patescibacteria group bacterium]|nr:hypothetical protein [Patescibacteria group bacterium]